jgi:hypothetical protein
MLMAEAKKYSTYCLEQFFFTNNGKHFAIVSRKKKCTYGENLDDQLIMPWNGKQFL